MAIKSNILIKLEDLDIFYQDPKTNRWYTGLPPNTDITDDLFRAGLFEQ